MNNMENEEISNSNPTSSASTSNTATTAGTSVDNVVEPLNGILSIEQIKIHKKKFDEFVNEKYVTKDPKTSKIINRNLYDEIFKLFKNDLSCSLTHNQKYYYKTVSDFEIMVKADGSEVLAKRCYARSRVTTGEKKQKDKSRYTIQEVATVENIFDILFQVHSVSNGHCGINKTMDLMQNRYSCIPRDLISKFINLCSICNMKHTQSVQPRLTAIRTNQLWERTQIDLIDMRHNKCDGYQYICHLEDHFSKFHVLWPMKNKSADEVAQGLRERVFPYFGLPSIFQSDNGLEFKNATIRTLIENWDGDCKIIYGRPRHPQSQGLVEQANGTTQRMLAATVSQNIIMNQINQSSKSEYKWPYLLPQIMFNLNTQRHSAAKATPYEIVFGKNVNVGCIKQIEDKSDSADYEDDDSENNPIGDLILDNVDEDESDDNDCDDESNDENDENEDTVFNNSTVQSKNLRARVSALQEKNVEVMERKHNRKRNKRTLEFEEGDFVTVLKPRVDRGGSDMPRLPGQIIKKSGEKDIFYKIATVYGILDVQYRVYDLEIYHGIILEKDINKNITISLREATLKSNIRTDLPEPIINCNCNGKCTGDGRCKCFKANVKCSSHCHVKSKCKICINL
jgi:transposase InsO family protein